MTTGEDFLVLAGKLAASSSANAATCRTSISRAYYGAFHLARQYIGSLGLKAGRDHGELQRWLLQSGNPKARVAGSYLVDLHSSRIKADYDLALRGVEHPAFAQECVELANDLRSIIGDLSNESDRAQIKDGIEAYRRKIGR